jgi:hypothetical protein
LHKGRKFVIGQRFRPARGRRAALAAAITGAALLGTNLLAAAPARADSGDCRPWGPGKGIAIGTTVPSGVYCFAVNVSGHQVLNTYGKYYFTSITLHAALYHEREVVRFYDKKNANYFTFWGPAYPGWRYGNVSWSTGIHGAVRPGRVCGSLRGNGKVLATVCEPLP